MDEPKKIKCDNVDYRKGYIEVTPGIHDNCINIETWDVHVDIDLSKIEIGDDDFPENGITGNTEIEMSVSEAELLISELQNAVAKIRGENA